MTPREYIDKVLRKDLFDPIMTTQLANGFVIKRLIPNYLTTDAAIEHQWMLTELRRAVAATFNMISMDGDMSTNDTCILFANGLAANKPINAQHPEAGTFREALRHITQYLAREMTRDGEGATKLMTVYVRGARDKADAVKAARGVTLSPLWQCALAGGDPNWGRILAALGRSGAKFISLMGSSLATSPRRARSAFSMKSKLCVIPA